jgi:membrane protein
MCLALENPAPWGAETMTWKAVLAETWQKYNQHEVPLLGAALAYYTLFAIFPLILLIVALIGYLQGAGVATAWDARTFVIRVMQVIFPTMRGTLSETISALIESRRTVSAIGLVTLLWSASHLFAQLHYSFNIIFGVRANEKYNIAATVRGKVLAMSLVFVLAALLFVSMFLNAFLTTVGEFMVHLPGGGQLWRVINVVVGLVIPTVVLTAVFRLLPDCPVSTRAAFLGGVLTAVAWKIGGLLLGWYIARNSYDAIYGAVGSTLALTVWVYYISQVLFVGAAFTSAYDHLLNEQAKQQELEAATAVMAGVAPRSRLTRLLVPEVRPPSRSFLGGVVAGIVFLLGGVVAALRRLTRRAGGL